MDLGWKPPPWGLALILLESSGQTVKGEKHCLLKHPLPQLSENFSHRETFLHKFTPVLIHRSSRMPQHVCFHSLYKNYFGQSTKYVCWQHALWLFFYPVIYWLLSSSWWAFSVDIQFLGWQFFTFSSWKMWYPSFWLLWLLMQSQLSSELFFPCR